MDVLNTIFTHALSSWVIYSVPLGIHRRLCHLQYADDLIILADRGKVDLRIIKLIPYLFEGISGLVIMSLLDILARIR